jgi:alpha-amylase
MVDYIQSMGFDAIWISPMPTNLNNDYHGYCFQDLYTPNPHFGSESDLLQFIDAAQKRDIWVMLDVVANHVAPVDLSFEKIIPFNQSAHYHSKCQIEDWNNQEQVETCRLANLPDLDQNNSYVRSTLLSWMSSLKARYNFDGYRVDTVAEVHPDFWTEWNAAAGSYCMGESFNGDVNYVSNYQNYLDGMLSYPLYFAITNVFAYQQSMSQFETLLGPTGTYWSKFKDVNLLGTFADNHDNPRFLYYNSNWNLYKNALVFSLFTSGIPIVYYGSEQGYSGGADPKNRESLWPNYNTNHELYKFISSYVAVRKQYKVYESSQVQRYSSTNFYSFSRGTTLVCLTNSGGSTVSITVSYLPYSVGQVVCNAVDSSDCLTVTTGGITVTLSNGLPKVYVPKQ